MKFELLNDYKSLIESVYNLTGDKDIENIIKRLESLDDSTQEVEKEFLEHRDDLNSPIYWIAILRILKFSFNLKKKLEEQYDSFVQIYQELTSRTNLTKDEQHLLTEIGNFLYRVDEIFGNQERFSHRLLHGMRQGIIEDYGVNLDIDDSFYQTYMSIETAHKTAPLIRELMDLLDENQEQIRIMNALHRLHTIIIRQSRKDDQSNDQTPTSPAPD